MLKYLDGQLSVFWPWISGCQTSGHGSISTDRVIKLGVSDSENIGRHGLASTVSPVFKQLVSNTGIYIDRTLKHGVSDTGHGIYIDYRTFKHRVSDIGHGIYFDSHDFQTRGCGILAMAFTLTGL